MKTGLTVMLSGILMLGTALAAPRTPQERYVNAVTVLKKHCDNFCGFGINGSPEERSALDAVWDATQDWTVTYLNAHSGESISRLNARLFKRRAGDRADVAPDAFYTVAPGMYGVTASWEWTGNTFLVAKRDGHFQVTWDIRKTDPSVFPILKAWRTAWAQNDCEHDHNKSRDVCGPIVANGFKLLPRDGHGRLRFALLATYGQLAETTVGGQISIWTLDGATPRLEWAKPYAYNFEDEGWRLKEGNLTIRATDWWRMFSACGTCIGRQMNWTIHLTPDGVRDLGMKPVVPELDAVDELFFRAWKHLPMDDLASPQVQATATRITTEAAASDAEMNKKYKVAPDPEHLFLGMIGGDPKAFVERAGDSVCFAADETGPMRIKFVRHADKLFATELTEFPQSDTENCPKSMP